MFERERKCYKSLKYNILFPKLVFSMLTHTPQAVLSELPGQVAGYFKTINKKA